MSTVVKNNRLSVKDITESEADIASAVKTESVIYADDEIGPGKNITMHFSLALADDGAVIDSNFEKAPVIFKIGDGNLLPGFERALLGFKTGLKQTLKINSEDAFGAVNEDNIQGFPRYQFPADLMLELGLMISFADAAGNEQAGVVKEFDADKVVVDFNHPLAGRDIEFKVEVILVSIDGGSAS